MEVTNIKNVSVHPNVGPSVPMRIITNITESELANLQPGDILDGKTIASLLGDPAVDIATLEKDMAAAKTKLAGIASGATKVIVEDSLTSDSAINAVSANQAMILKDLIDALEIRVAALETV